jgi:hypothetical protein
VPDQVIVDPTVLITMRKCSIDSMILLRGWNDLCADHLCMPIEIPRWTIIQKANTL